MDSNNNNSNSNININSNDISNNNFNNISNSNSNGDGNTDLKMHKDINNHGFECCICKQSVGLPEWFVTCTTCGITVHCSCYFIAEVIDRSIPWNCKPCRLNEDPNILTCDLCSNKGGAYLHTEKKYMGSYIML